MKGVEEGKSNTYSPLLRPWKTRSSHLPSPVPLARLILQPHPLR